MYVSGICEPCGPGNISSQALILKPSAQLLTSHALPLVASGVSVGPLHVL